MTTPRFVTTRRVAFSETDAAGLLHFSRYPVWMEDAEHAFLRAGGFTVHGRSDAEGAWLFPRVRVEVDYRAPLRFEDEVQVELDVAEVRTKAIVYAFTFRRDSEVVCVGRVVAVFARATVDGIRGAPLPEDLRRHLVSDPSNGG